MVDRFAAQLQTLVDVRGSRMLVATSGGPDSTALLYLLSDVSERYALELVAAVVNHRLRNDREVGGEIELLREHTRRVGVRLIEHKLPVGSVTAYAESQSIGIEAAARRLRYDALDSVAERESCSLIALGHTADDVDETLIQRFFQGSGCEGLGGIPVSRDRYLRPIISCSRKEILRFLDSRRIEYATDPSNTEERFLRSRIRHSLLPDINAVFPGYRRGLASLSEKMRDDAAFLTAESDRRIPRTVSRDPAAISVLRADFNGAPPTLRRLALHAACNEWYRLSGIKDRRVPYRAIRALVRHGAGERGVQVSTDTIHITVDSGRLVFDAPVVFDTENGYLIVVDGATNRHHEVALRGGVCHLDVHPVGASKTGVGVVGFPVLVRSRIPGDVLVRDRGATPVKRILANWAVPPERRWRVPVVQDSRGIAAVLGEQECGEIALRSSHPGATLQTTMQFTFWIEE